MSDKDKQKFKLIAAKSKEVAKKEKKLPQVETQTKVSNKKPNQN